MTVVANAAEHRVRIPEVLSGLTVYMPTSAVPNAAKLAGGKSWLELNISRAIGRRWHQLSAHGD